MEMQMIQTVPTSAEMKKATTTTMERKIAIITSMTTNQARPSKLSNLTIINANHVMANHHPQMTSSMSIAPLMMTATSMTSNVFRQPRLNLKRKKTWRLTQRQPLSPLQAKSKTSLDSGSTNSVATRNALPKSVEVFDLKTSVIMDRGNGPHSCTKCVCLHDIMFHHIKQPHSIPLNPVRVAKTETQRQVDLRIIEKCHTTEWGMPERFHN